MILPTKEAFLDEHTHVTSQHEALLESRRKQFVGRAKLVKKALALMCSETPPASGIVMLAGRPGTGKSTLLAEIAQQYLSALGAGGAVAVLTHVVGAAPGSTHVVAMLRRLCHEMKRRFALRTGVPDELK